MTAFLFVLLVLSMACNFALACLLRWQWVARRENADECEHWLDVVENCAHFSQCSGCIAARRGAPFTSPEVGQA